jgi:hypothetical protein
MGYTAIESRDNSFVKSLISQAVHDGFLPSATPSSKQSILIMAHWFWQVKPSLCYESLFFF